MTNAALQFLGEGETLTQTYTLTVDDGHAGTAGQLVTIVLTGDNDPIVITSAAQADSLTEDGTSVGGSITFSDVDLSDAHTAGFVANAANTTSLGTFSVDAAVTEAPNAANGSLGWSYAVNNSAAQYLAVGESAVEKYDVTFNDGHGGTITETVTVTITGSNDGPDIRADAGDSAAACLYETNLPLSTSGTLTVVDIDTSDVVDTAVTNISVSGNQGALTDAQLLAMLSLTGDDDLDANSGDSHNLGWNFNSGSEAFNHLDDGESLALTYTLTSSDGNGGSDTQTVTVTIKGSNDAPVSGGDDSASGTEDDALISGTVPAATDVDVEPLTYHLVAGSVEVDGSPVPDGTVTFNSDGSYSYAPTLGDQGLDDGESHVVTFNYVANDGTADSSAASVAITVNGVNDAPVSGGDDSASGTEDDALDQRHRPGGDRRRRRAADLSSGRRLGRSRRLARARRNGDVQLGRQLQLCPDPGRPGARRRREPCRHVQLCRQRRHRRQQRCVGGDHRQRGQ